jgi:hypothetical protein
LTAQYPSRLTDLVLLDFPNLLSDLKKRINILADNPSGITDPFDSIYEIVFQLTMRTVGCNEVADDPELVKATMSYNRMMELAGTPMAVMFPWLPSRGVLRKYYAGARMYMIFDKVAKARLAEERRENDAMQVMLDQGDSVKDILGVMQSARLSEKSVLTLTGRLWVSFRRSAEQRHQCSLGSHLPF